MDTAGLAGTGPEGSATLTDVLRQAGRTPPAAARPPPPRTVFRAGEESDGGSHRLEVVCDAEPVRGVCRALAALAVEPPEVFDIVVRLCGTALRDHPGLAGAAADGEEGTRPGSIDVLVAGSAGTVPIRGVDAAGVRSIRESMRAGRPESGAPPKVPSEGGRAGSEGGVVIRAPETPDSRSGTPAGEEARRHGGAVLFFSEQSDSIVLGLELAAGPEGEAETFLERLRSLCLDPRRALL